MSQALEQIYASHHANRRGRGFVLLGEQRGKFLAERIGTGQCVLDIGCRDGALTRYFATGNQVLGLDIDSEALAIARQQLGIATRQVDLNGEWGLEPRSFDVVVVAEVLEHLYYPAAVLKKIHAALKPGGKLVGSVPHAFSLQNRLRLLVGRKRGTPLEDPTHINHFTAAELRQLLEHEFSAVELLPILSPRLGILGQVFPNAFAYSFLFAAVAA